MPFETPAIVPNLKVTNFIFLDVDKNNGCLQVLKGCHDPERVLEHKLEKKAGVKDSWYLYIEDKNEFKKLNTLVSRLESQFQVGVDTTGE